MKKYSIFLLLPILLLAGCAQNQEEQTKKDFFVETRQVSDFTNQIVIQKSATLQSDQNINVSAQANGRVGNILVKEGDTVKEGQAIIQLKDDVSNYGIALKRAKNAINAAQLQYNNAKINLEKGVFNSELNIKNKENLLEATTSAGILSLKKAKQDLNSSETSLKTIKSQLSLEKTKLENLLDGVLELSDKMFGVTNKNEHFNDTYDYLLGARDPRVREEAEKMREELVENYDEIMKLSTESLTNEQLRSAMDKISENYEFLNSFLQQLTEVMQESIDAAGGWIEKERFFESSISSYQANATQLSAAFNGYKTQVNSLLADSQDPDKNVMKSSANIALESTKTQIEKNLKDVKLGLEDARKTYETAIKTKNSQLDLLANNITQAKIAYEDIATQYAKLTIKSPISGVIGSIGVDKGQEVRMGTPVFTVSSKNEQLIKVAVSSNEYGYLKNGQEVQITYENNMYTGTVSSISSVAGRNGLYTVEVATQSDIPLLGGIAEIEIPVHVEGFWLPVNIITIIGDNKGYVYSLEGTGLQKHILELGEVWGNNIHIKNMLTTGMSIVTTNVENFNPLDHTLVEKE